MTIDKWVVTISGIMSILFTYWFFFAKFEEKVEAKGTVNIKVEGGYSPSYIIVKKGASTTLRFTRTDDNPCLEEVNIPDFKIKKYLPVNQPVDIIISPDQKGEFPFSCGMNMYFGKISVL